MSPRLQRYTLARLAIYVAILAVTVAVVAEGGWTGPGRSGLLYVTAAALAVVVASTVVLQVFPGSSRALYAQFAIDLGISTAMCAYTGGISSPLLLLYYPTIASAAYLRGLSAALATATLATLLLVGVTVLGADPTTPEIQLVLYYEVMFRVFAFYLIAALSGTLAESAERSGRELVEARRSSMLLASEHQMVLDTVRAGVVTTGADRRVQAINPAARAMLGEIAGRPLEDVLPNVRDAAVTGLAWEEVRPDGQRWVCSAAELADGGAVIVVEDVTELEEMRERHARDERLVAVGRLAASMAHEIRNPLSSLSGALQMIAEEHPSRLAALGLAEADRLNRLVEDFLASARPVALRRATVDLAELVRGTTEAFAADPRFAGQVQATCRGAAAPALVDADRMRQVLWNLLLNGAQAMPRGGRIQVEVAPARKGGRDGVQVVVTDEGVGIAPKDRTRVFDPFFTTRVGGSGLGLAVVDQVVRGHGGTVEILTPDGGGTEFRIWLPKEIDDVG